MTNTVIAVIFFAFYLVALIVIAFCAGRESKQ